MDSGTETSRVAARLPRGNEESNQLLMRAVMLSENAQGELRRARKARSDAEKIREEAEAEKTQAMDDAFASVKAKAQALMEEATAASATAESDRLQAHEELEHAEAVREETKRECAQLEADSRERSEQALHEGRLQARAKIAEMELAAEEEMRRILGDIEVLHAAAQEEVKAQRLLTAAARLRAGNPDLELLAELASGVGSIYDGNGASASKSASGATGSSKKVAEPEKVEPEPETVAPEPETVAPEPAPSEPEALAELEVVGAGQTNGHAESAPRSTRRTTRRSNGTKKKA